MKHEVLFHIGTGTVVCTCGTEFRAQPSSLDFGDGVTLWARHIREVAGLNLQDAYDAGWHDHYLDLERQEKYPNYPIGRGKRTNYPHMPTNEEGDA